MKARAILRLPKYFVLQDQDVVKLNQNESPYDVPLKLKSRITRKLARMKWNRYPPQRPDRLIRAIARYARVKPANIVIGNSSNEIIQAVIQTACVRGDRLVTVSPGFAIYPRVGRIMGLDVREVQLGPCFEFDVDKIITASRNARLVMIASPNSPTGTVLGTNAIEILLKKAQCLVAIDEAYFEFYHKTAARLLKKYNNLIIIRTLSKAFSLAGVRLGYLIARPEIAKAVGNVRLPFTVGWFAQAAGLEALKHNAYVGAFVNRITKERERVFSELAGCGGVKPILSKTNFILFEIRGRKARVIFDALYKKGVLVRSYDTARLKNYLRVTIGTREENETFLDALKAVMEEI